MATSDPPPPMSLSPGVTTLCSAVVLFLHCVYGGFYIFEAYEYLRQTVVESVVLTFIYRLLGLGATVHRSIYSALGITDTWIAFWHITGLVRAIRASIRFRRLLLDVPNEKIAANIKTKLTAFAYKTGLPAGASEVSPQTGDAHPQGCIVVVKARARRWIASLKSIKREYFTMDGQHFETGANVRESFELITQINLMLRMSQMISEQKINDLVVSVFSINCWSTPVLRYVFRHASDPFPSRVSRHIVGMLLASCFTVAVPGAIWGFALPMAGTQAVMFDQVLSARVRYLLRHVLITEWSQVVSTRVAACTAILGIETLKRKLTALSQRHSTSRILAVTEVVDADDPANSQPAESNDNCKYKPTPGADKQGLKPVDLQPPQRRRFRASHLFDFVWFATGVIVVALHVDARNDPPLPVGFKCEMPMHPWMSNQVACAVLEINCYRGGISGSEQEMDRVLQQVDVAMLSTLRITHCPALTMPKHIQTLSNLALLEVYNSTFVAWTAEAALSTRYHPYLGSVWLVRVSGIPSLPLGLQDAAFPTADIIISRSDLADLPVNLTNSWPHMMSKMVVEHSRLTAFPTALLTISGVALSLAGNNLTVIPASALHGHRFSYFSVAENPHLQSLPDAGWSSAVVDARKTNLSIAPAWIKAGEGSGMLMAGATPLCAIADTTTSAWLDCTAPPDAERVSGLFPFVEMAPLRQP